MKEGTRQSSEEGNDERGTETYGKFNEEQEQQT